MYICLALLLAVQHWSIHSPSHALCTHTHAHMHAHTHAGSVLKYGYHIAPTHSSAAGAVSVAASAWPLECVRKNSTWDELTFPATLLLLLLVLLYLRMFFFCVRFSHDQNTVVSCAWFRLAAIPAITYSLSARYSHPINARNVLSCARRAYLMSSDRQEVSNSHNDNIN